MENKNENKQKDQDICGNAERQRWDLVDKEHRGGNSLVVQWLGPHALSAKGPGSVPGRGTKIPQAMRCGQKQTNTEGR